MFDPLCLQRRYTLKNSSGTVVQVVELGATITSVLVPDKHGDFDDVTTGFDTVAGKCDGRLCVTYRASSTHWHGY